MTDGQRRPSDTIGLVTYEETASWLPVDVRRAIEAALPPGDGHGTWAGFQRHRLRDENPCYHCEVAVYPVRRRRPDG